MAGVRVVTGVQVCRRRTDRRGPGRLMLRPMVEARHVGAARDTKRGKPDGEEAGDERPEATAEHHRKIMRSLAG
jgi:hypothetical protein